MRLARIAFYSFVSSASGTLLMILLTSLVLEPGLPLGGAMLPASIMGAVTGSYAGWHLFVRHSRAESFAG